MSEAALEKNPELEKEQQADEPSAEGALRPLSLDDFIGHF